MGLCAARPNKSFALPKLGCEDCKRIIEALPRQIVNAYLLIDQKWSGFENLNAFERTLSVNKGQPKSKWGFLLPSVSLQVVDQIFPSQKHTSDVVFGAQEQPQYMDVQSPTHVDPISEWYCVCLPYSSLPTSRLSTCILLSSNNSRQLFFSNSNATTMQY